MPDAIVVLFSWPMVVGLAVLPLIALGIMWNARKSRNEGNIRTSTSYLILLFGGFLGLHRLFLRSFLWVLYLPLVGFFVYSLTAEGRAFSEFSVAKDQLEQVDSTLARHHARANSATGGIEAARARLADSEPKSEETVSELELEIERESARAAEARAAIAKIDDEVPVLKNHLLKSSTSRRFWSDMAFKMLLVILAFMAVDAFLIPALTRRAEVRGKMHT